MLSAVEGLELATPLFGSYVVPIGNCGAGRAVCRTAPGHGGRGCLVRPPERSLVPRNGGRRQHPVWRDSAILDAFNPAYAVAFLSEQGVIGLAVPGAVFLSVTGAEVFCGV